MFRWPVLALAASTVALAGAHRPDHGHGGGGGLIGAPELVASFVGPMPTGVTVSKAGRIFVNYPRWGDPVKFTVAELKHGKPVAYPPGLPQVVDPAASPEKGLVSVQSVVVDPSDRLWLVDTGSVKFGATHPGGPKLVAVDLATDRVIRTIPFPATVALPTSYMNDVRFDLKRGKGGYAYLTDSSDKGPNAIVVVDLATGESWRRLQDHPSVKAEPDFKPVVAGQVLMQRKPGQPPKPIHMGADGIAISADGKRLFYCALASHELYSVDAGLLADRSATEQQVAASVRDEGKKPASDGLESDAANHLYATDYEHHGVLERDASGRLTTLVASQAIDWPDTLSLGPDGYLYFTSNQLDKGPDYHGGKDLRTKRYQLYRVEVDQKPVGS